MHIHFSRLFIFIFVIFMGFAQALTSSLPPGISVGSSRIMEDSGGNLTIDRVTALGERFKAVTKTPNYGFTSNACWLRIPVTNKSAKTVSLFLDVLLPTLDSLTLYVTDSGRPCQVVVSGDRIPVRNRPYTGSCSLVLPFNLNAGQSAQLYLRVHADAGEMIIPHAIMDEKTLYDSQLVERYFHGIFFGLMLALFIVNILTYVLLRQRSYFYYLMYLPVVYFAVSILDGSFPYFLWPGSAWMSNEGLVMFSSLSYVFILLFTRSFLHTFEYKRIDTLVKILIGFCIFSAFSWYVLPISMPYFSSTLMFFLFPVFSTIIGVFMWRKKHTEARFFVAGQIWSWVGLFLFGLFAKGVLQYNTLLYEGITIGVAMDSLMLSLALADRIRILQKAKLAAEYIALKNLEVRKEELEGLVASRTAELHNSMLNLSELKDRAEAATRAKSDFLSNMSHEIRTPMNAVIGFGELLKNTQLSEQQRDYVETICSSGEMLTALINDILDISKIESHKIVLEEIDFDLEQLIRSVFKILRQRLAGKPIELYIDYPVDVPRSFKGDPTRIRQVLLNLVSNASKFTDKGEISVSVGFDDDNGEGVLDESRIRISVKDTGIGIPKEKQGELFHAFKQIDSSITRKYGGTGLGLAISKALVEKMGGVMRIESDAGKGSEFIFTLRLAKGQPVVDKDIVPLDTEMLKNKKILIVDDNANSREILSNYCGFLGMKTEYVASSAFDALQWLKDENHIVDIILSDIMMPGMDGYSFASRVSADPRHKDAKLIALTSAAIPGAADESGKAGFDAFLTKPFMPRDLLGILRVVLGDKRKGDAQIITHHMAEELSLKGLFVLVVEDNPINQKLVGIFLKQFGCVFETAGNGQEAVAKMREKKFDLVLMDLQMPVMDGFEATMEIRNELKKDTPIIALTAHVFKEDEEKCLAVGMNGFLIKPVGSDALREKILKLAGK